jgi:hypothetical protein
MSILGVKGILGELQFVVDYLVAELLALFE